MRPHRHAPPIHRRPISQLEAPPHPSLQPRQPEVQWPRERAMGVSRGRRNERPRRVAAMATRPTRNAAPSVDAARGGDAGRSGRRSPTRANPSQPEVLWPRERESAAQLAAVAVSRGRTASPPWQPDHTRRRTEVNTATECRCRPRRRHNSMRAKEAARRPCKRLQRRRRATRKMGPVHFAASDEEPPLAPEHLGAQLGRWTRRSPESGKRTTRRARQSQATPSTQRPRSQPARRRAAAENVEQHAAEAAKTKIAETRTLQTKILQAIDETPHSSRCQSASDGRSETRAGQTAAE